MIQYQLTASRRRTQGAMGVIGNVPWPACLTNQHEVDGGLFGDGAVDTLFAAHHPSIQQALHIPTVVANDVDVDRLLTDFVNHAIHAGNDLAVLASIWLLRICRSQFLWVARGV